MNEIVSVGSASSMLLATGVTVTVCGVAKSPVVNVICAGTTVTCVPGDPAASKVTTVVGCVSREKTVSTAPDASASVTAVAPVRAMPAVSSLVICTVVDVGSVTPS